MKAIILCALLSCGFIFTGRSDPERDGYVVFQTGCGPSIYNGGSVAIYADEHSAATAAMDAQAACKTTSVWGFRTNATNGTSYQQLYSHDNHANEARSIYL